MVWIHWQSLMIWRGYLEQNSLLYMFIGLQHVGNRRPGEHRKSLRKSLKDVNSTLSKTNSVHTAGKKLIRDD